MGEPEGELIWGNVFMFKTDRDFKESVVWRKYAPLIIDVHKLGCEKQASDRRAGRTNATYIGALTANVGEVRNIRSAKGARFRILHEPDEGIHHAEISYDPNHSLTRNDKAELKMQIKSKFQTRDDHICFE